jgi:hypothetical protein
VVGGARRSVESCAAHSKSEWPAHDSTDAPRLAGELGNGAGAGGKRKSRLRMEGETVASRRREERFLSAQADPFAGAKGEEKVGLLRSE